MSTRPYRPQLPTITEDIGPVAALHVYYKRYCEEKEGARSKRFKETPPPADIADRIHAWIVLLDTGRTYDLFCSIWNTYKSGVVATTEEALIDAMHFVLLHMTTAPEECRTRLVTLLAPEAQKPAWDKKHD